MRYPGFTKLIQCVLLSQVPKARESKDDEVVLKGGRDWYILRIITVSELLRISSYDKSFPVCKA